VTVRLSARLAGLAILGAQILATAPNASSPAGLAARAIIVAIELAAIIWATRQGAAGRLKLLVPAALTGVTAAAIWTALAFAAHDIATNDTLAFVAIAGAGTAVAVWPPSGTNRRRQVVLVASATAALLIFVAISSVLPAFDGFVTNWHPPTYTDVTRLVDPILEFAIFVVLTLAICVDALWVRARRRHSAARERSVPDEPVLNEMVVVPTDIDNR
jgi:hypothetical protein